ncbi:MAG: polyprenyl synthetase family protein [Candidatus Thorarchaeota archaeon]
MDRVSPLIIKQQSNDGVRYLIEQEFIRQLDLETSNGELHEAIRQVLHTKQIRYNSLLMLMYIESVGGKYEPALPISVAIDSVEIAHDMHTSKFAINDNIAILAGDLLISHAIRIVSEFGEDEIIQNLSEAIATLAKGEAQRLTMILDKPESITLDNYNRFIQHRTIIFWKIIAKIGAALGNASQTHRTGLINYATMLGFAYHLQRDTEKVEEMLAERSVWDDQEGWKNYIFVSLLESSPNNQIQIIKMIREGKRNELGQLISDKRIIERTKQLSSEYLHKAKQYLKRNVFQDIERFLLMADIIAGPLREHSFL